MRREYIFRHRHMIMDQRKIILFGKSAFCMTLPHAWVKKNNLKKGDVLNVQETHRSSLELIPSSVKLPSTSSLNINITGKSTDEIIQILLATYLNGYTVITLEGTNVGKVSFLRNHIHEFIAAEIMEVTNDKIVIHVFWDIETIDLTTILRRIGHIIRSIFEETADLLDSKTRMNDITEKGYEVQRQVLLAKRAITYALNNSATAQKFNLSSLELYYISYIVYFSGKVAEHIQDISEIIVKAINNKEMTTRSKKNLKKLLERTLSYYDKILSIYNKKGEHQRFQVSEFEDFEESINAFRSENKNSWRPIVTVHLMQLISTIKEMEFVMINLENTPKT